LAPGRIEGVADRHVDVFVPPGGHGVAADDDVLPAGHLQTDAHAVGVSLVMTMLRPSDDDPRRGDAIVETLEFVRFLAHASLDGIRMVDMLEHDLKGNLHPTPLVASCSRRELRAIPP
jgi:hypothetical protein